MHSLLPDYMSIENNKPPHKDATNNTDTIKPNARQFSLLRIKIIRPRPALHDKPVNNAPEAIKPCKYSSHKNILEAQFGMNPIKQQSSGCNIPMSDIKLETDCDETDSIIILNTRENIKTNNTTENVRLHASRKIL